MFEIEDFYFSSMKETERENLKNRYSEVSAVTSKDNVQTSAAANFADESNNCTINEIQESISSDPEKQELVKSGEGGKAFAVRR